MGNNLESKTSIHVDSANQSHGDDIGMFTVKTANNTVLDAALRPTPKDLFMGLWFEGEAACLFADSNLGKSIFAVQIADQLAVTEPVLYVDCELSDKQFQLRYTDTESGIPHQFPSFLYRAEINPASFNTSNYEEHILQNIEEMADRMNCRAIIIDNIGYLCNASDKGTDAGSFMVKLMSVKKRKGWSVLVIAHTPKRSLSSPITQNDLAGSKRLFNYFDSVFAIGLSARDNKLRYVKQLKARSSEIRYDSGNVILYEIVKSKGFLQFSLQGFAKESEHLRESNDIDLEQRKLHVAELKAAGRSIRDIASELGLSKSTVGRVIKDLETVPPCPTVPSVPAGTVGQDDWKSYISPEYQPEVAALIEDLGLEYRGHMIPT